MYILIVIIKYVAVIRIIIIPPEDHRAAEEDRGGDLCEEFARQAETGLAQNSFNYTNI